MCHQGWLELSAPVVSILPAVYVHVGSWATQEGHKKVSGIPRLPPDKISGFQSYLLCSYTRKSPGPVWKP